MKNPAGGQTLSESTYQALSSMILQRELPGGKVIEERPLSEILDISRTPLRIALSRLHGEGMLERLSNGLYMVPSPTIGEYLDLLQLRRLLEGEACACAAGRMDPAVLSDLRARIEAMASREEADLPVYFALDEDLHLAIAKASGNVALEQTIATVRRRVRMCNVNRYPGRFRENCREHLEILQAIADGDAVAARNALNHHLTRVWDGFVDNLARR
ncbi:MAG: GntR family transcriptional regulator [Devosia sp.]|uniref:GntR family transcriptional regulator n=1 Tax=Devosia sp. TaxID=1871048 RepID=UPI001A642134|nr:GntR family transcriptional regulator [Devosia sp.]MBL8600249.1 GntR family transcriptional regulator [Devosia sp.]